MASSKVTRKIRWIMGSGAIWLVVALFMVGWNLRHLVMDQVQDLPVVHHWPKGPGKQVMVSDTLKIVLPRDNRRGRITIENPCGQPDAVSFYFGNDLPPIARPTEWFMSLVPCSLYDTGTTVSVDAIWMVTAHPHEVTVRAVTK